MRFDGYVSDGFASGGSALEGSGSGGLAFDGFAFRGFASESSASGGAASESSASGGAASDGFTLAPARDANKYSRGKLVVVAGSDRYPGAAVLAARASQRMGAGYTEVITADGAVGIVLMASPSLVVRPFAEWDVASDVPAPREGHPCAVCVGPGFVPGDARSGELALRILEHACCPVLVDGGALAALGAPEGVRRLSERAEGGRSTVVTPHGGEAARLARAIGVGEAPPDRLASALASALGAVVVLKGPDTYVSDGARTHVMIDGTPALAKAGTGDVLAGMVSALLAQGIDAFEAAACAAVVHARAGVVASERLAEVSVTAEDVVEAVPFALKATGLA